MKGLPFPPSITPSSFLALSSKELQLKDSTANVPPGSIHARDTSPLFLVDYYHRPPLPRPLSLSPPFETADACIMGPDRGGWVSRGARA